MFKLANDGIFGFSDFPVKIPAIIGGILFLLSLAIGGCILTVDVNHFLSECFFFLFLVVMSLQFFCLWIIGEYVARIYNESRERPIYVAAEKLP